MGGNFVDTIKRVQDLMQERDMNLCVLAKKCGISYSTIQTTARRGGQLRDSLTSSADTGDSSNKL